MLALLQENGYSVRGYHDWNKTPRCVILRHDIDNSLPQAVRLAELEAEEGARSTYFVLLRTDFYNPASRDGLEALRHILSLGHEIGLHFDEASYAPALKPDQIIQNIIKECGLLSALLETRVSRIMKFPVLLILMEKLFSTISNTSPTAAEGGGNRYWISSVPGNMISCTF